MVLFRIFGHDLRSESFDATVRNAALIPRFCYFTAFGCYHYLDVSRQTPEAVKSGMRRLLKYLPME